MDIADPTEHGFDPSRLRAIDRFIEDEYLAPGLLPHAQLLIARDSRIVHFRSQGTAREDGTPVTHRTLFRIASMTKPITSLGFMMLVEEGKVALDTPVARVIPEFAHLGVAGADGPPAEPMRMIDLLRHTAGFTYSLQRRTPIDADYLARRIDAWPMARDTDGFLAALADLPLEFAPGTAWNYSVATDVLGAVIERLSGTTLDRFLHNRIFAPLGMGDTLFQVPAGKIDRLADCWTTTSDGRSAMFDRGADSLWADRPAMASGGAGLVSTALDYHRFCALCLAGGTLDGVRLVGRKTMALMTTNHLPGGRDLAMMSRSMFSEATNAGVGFGLGFAVTGNVAPTMMPGSVGEFYWGGVFSTFFSCDPRERLHFVLMTQQSPSSRFAIRRALKTMIYAALI